jgi:hypothetical protein
VGKIMDQHTGSALNRSPINERSAAPTAPRDGSEEQFGVESSAREVRGDYGSRSLSRETGIKENNDRRPRAAQRCAQNARPAGQLLQAWQQGAQ